MRQKQLDDIEKDIEWDFARYKKYPDHLEDNLGSVITLLEKIFEYIKLLR